MDRAQKHAFVKDFNTVAANQSLFVLTRQTGLSATETEELRGCVRENDASFRIIKNTLLRLALKGTSAEGLLDHLKGPTGLSYSKDPLAAAKAVAKFAKANKKLEIVAGSLNGQTLDSKGIKDLAELPSLDALRGRIIGLVLAPLQKVARTASAPASQIARVLGAYSQKS